MGYGIGKYIDQFLAAAVLNKFRMLIQGIKTLSTNLITLHFIIGLFIEGFQGKVCAGIIVSGFPGLSFCYGSRHSSRLLQPAPRNHFRLSQGLLQIRQP